LNRQEREKTELAAKAAKNAKEYKNRSKRLNRQGAKTPRKTGMIWAIARESPASQFSPITHQQDEVKKVIKSYG